MHKRLPNRLKEAVTLLFPVTTPIFFVNKTVNRGVQNRAKLLIYIGKVVVGGTGLESVPIVSYLVIKCHIYMDMMVICGHTWSQTFI